MKRSVVGIVLVSLLLAPAAFSTELTGIDRNEISLKAGPTEPGETLSMVWVEALVFPKEVKGDRIISLGMRLTSRAEKVSASFDFGYDTVALSSDDGLYWSGAYRVPDTVAAGLHVARYTVSASRGSIQRTVDFTVSAEKGEKASADDTQIYETQGWPLTVASTCTAMVDGGIRILYGGQKVIGLSKVPWYKIAFENGEVGWVQAAKVEEPTEEYFKLGRQAFEGGRYSSAVNYFKDVAAIEPSNAKAYFWMAKSYQKKGDLNSAYQMLSEAMRLNDRDMESKVFASELSKSFYELASGKFKGGRYHEAVAAYQKVVELKPNSSSSWIEMGQSYSKLGMGEEARSAWREAQRYGSNYAAAAVPEPLVVMKKAKPVALAVKEGSKKIAKAPEKEKEKVPALVADDSLQIVKGERTKKGTSIENALKSVVALTKSLGTPVAEKGWDIKNKGEKFLVSYICEQGSGVREAFEFMVDVDTRNVTAYNDNARLLMSRW